MSKDNSHKLEQLVRGFSNKNRIHIMQLLQKKPELSVSELSEHLGAEEKTISAHTLRLMRSGLVMKRNSGKQVRHKLTERGPRVVEFLQKLA